MLISIPHKVRARIFSVSFLARLTLSLSLFRLLFFSYYDNSETWNYRNTTTETTRKSSEISTHSLDVVEEKNSGREKCSWTLQFNSVFNTFKKKKKNNTKKPKKLRRVEFSVLRSYDTSRWTWNRRCVKWKKSSTAIWADSAERKAMKKSGKSHLTHLSGVI